MARRFSPGLFLKPCGCRNLIAHESRAKQGYNTVQQGDTPDSVAAAIIVAHNHPSGDPSPSPDDVAITPAIVQAGKLLDSKVTQTLTPSFTFYAGFRPDTLLEDDFARALFENVGMSVKA